MDDEPHIFEPLDTPQGHVAEEFFNDQQQRRRKRHTLRNVFFVGLFIFFLLFIFALYRGSRLNLDTRDISPLYSSMATDQDDLESILVENPESDSQITFPLSLEGKAMGIWYFEEVFPVTLYDLEDNVIAREYVTAQGNTSTKDFVNFKGVFEQYLRLPETPFGNLVFQRNDPSGIIENYTIVVVPIEFDHNQIKLLKDSGFDRRRTTVTLNPDGTVNIQRRGWRLFENPFSLGTVTPEITTPTTQQAIISLYFPSTETGVRCEFTSSAPVRTLANDDDLIANTLRELVKGVTQTEYFSGYRSLINPQITQLSFEVKKGTATVIFPQDPFRQDNEELCSRQQMKEQITQTLLQFPSIDHVQVMIEGVFL